ncbi:hypothetical protein C8J57DRAFT_648648 [Mycena rebaudengoi]|nr:hypothetical protein C8J57DRAFT_648648 [Mycena rebaudengoi]
MSAQLHSVILLGNSDRVDGWMMADACKLAWAVANAKGEHHFICPGSPERYKGFSDGGFIIGEPRSDRLCIPVPAHIEIHRSPLVLKQQFLRHLSDLSKQIKPKDTLFIGLCSHGRETDGAVCVGNIDSSEDSDSEYLTITEVKAALRRKPASTRTVLWLTTCFSGYWTREPAWEAFAAARHGQESQSIPASPSGQGMHILSSFIAHGEQSGVRYPYSVGGPEHYFNGIPLPPLFSHSLLAQLTLIPHIALDYTTPMLPPISRTAQND